MSFTDAQILLEKKFADGWGNTIPCAFTNVPFSQPAGGKFVRFNIIPGDGSTASLGDSKLVRQLGVVMLQIFTAKNAGNKDANVLADAGAVILRNKQWTQNGMTVNTRAPYRQEVGERRDYYQVNLIVPFQVDEYFG